MFAVVYSERVFKRYFVVVNYFISLHFSVGDNEHFERDVA